MNCAKCAEHRAAALIGAGTATRRSVGGRGPRLTASKLVGSGSPEGHALWQGKPARAVGASAEAAIPCMTQQMEPKCAAYLCSTF